jgi:hypothetical protein
MLQLLIIALTVLNLNAEEIAPVAPVTPVMVDQETKEALPVKATVDYKAQMEKLTPKLDKQKIETVEQPWLAYVKSVEGKVQIKRYNDKGDIIITFPPVEGTLLKSRDVIDIESNGRAELGFKNMDTINLGPSTLLRIEKADTYTLLLGSMRIRAKNKKEKQNIYVYAPNTAVVTQPKADLAIRYDGKEKISQIACFDGKLTVNGIRDSKELKAFERGIESGQTMSVVTSFEKGREAYIPTEPERLSLESKRALLESFYSDPSKVDSWEYTRIATSFFRFAPSFEYTKFRELTDKTYINFTLGYVPLIYLGSIFYLEPYFYVSFANPFTNFFYRVGGSLQINPFAGAYLGIGGGVFWIHGDTADYGSDFTFNVGYTLAEKLMSFIDGFRFSYFASRASGFHNTSYMLSVIINISHGRELY